MTDHIAAARAALANYETGEVQIPEHLHQSMAHSLLAIAEAHRPAEAVAERVMHGAGGGPTTPRPVVLHSRADLDALMGNRRAARAILLDADAEVYILRWATSPASSSIRFHSLQHHGGGFIDAELLDAPEFYPGRLLDVDPLTEAERNQVLGRTR